MQLTTVKELFANRETYLNTEVEVGGWIRSIRDSKAFGFIVLNDGTCFDTLQIVYHDTMDNFAEVSKLNVGAAIIVKGTLVPTPEAKQPFEIQATEVFVEGPSNGDYPLQKKRHSFEYLRTISHLRPRTNTFQAVFRVRSMAAYAIHKFFQEQGFVYVNTPLITGSDCEGAGEMFRVTTLDMDNPPRTEDGKIDFSKDFFGKSTIIYRTVLIQFLAYTLFPFSSCHAITHNILHSFAIFEMAIQCTENVAVLCATFVSVHHLGSHTYIIHQFGHRIALFFSICTCNISVKHVVPVIMTL